MTHLQQRILDSVEFEANTGCWLWTGPMGRNMRGTLMHERRQVLASRLSLEAYKGPIPPGMFACHKCDTPACVNPDHLFAGTPQDNVDDMIAKGRRREGVRLFGEAHRLSKLSDGDVRVIRALLQDHSSRKIARYFGLYRNAIDNIKTGKTWRRVIGQMSPDEQARHDTASAALAELRSGRKLTAEAVAYIRSVYQPRHPEYGAHPLAKRFGVTHGAISMAARGITGGAFAAREGVSLNQTEAA
jgi:hypothetical protein